MESVLDAIREERRRQHAMRGVQTLPVAVSGADALALRKMLRLCRQRQNEGRDAWPWVLLEEALEACLATSEADRRAELVQTAAVAVQWAEGLAHASEPLLVEDVTRLLDGLPPIPPRASVPAPGCTCVACSWARLTPGAGQGGDQCPTCLGVRHKGLCAV